MATLFAAIALSFSICQSASATTPADWQTNLSRSDGVHPRLFLNTQGVTDLKLAIQGDRKQVWQAFLAQAVTDSRRTPPAYKSDTGEQLWQRGVGNTLSTLAFAYLLSGDRKYLDSASAWATASCRYPTWGKDAKTGEGYTEGLAYGHQLLGLAMLYDYAYRDLDPATRDLIRATMESRASTMYHAFISAPYPLLQNHSWIMCTGLMAAGMALFDEDPDAREWIALASHVLDASTQLFSPDGASQEGFGYWEYGTEYLLKMMYLAKPLLGREIDQTPWWTNAPLYGLYMMIPRNAWTPKESVVDFADCPRYSWYGPDYQMREYARQDRSGIAQWLAEQTDAAGVVDEESPWLNVLWQDSSVLPTPPDSLPTLHDFANMGIVSARSDWSGNESLVVFKCGAPLGEFAPEHYASLVTPMDFGHTHPDAAHFVIFGDGEWLIRNLGYIQRQTRYHNTLMIDGHGQYGEGPGWFQPWPPYPGQKPPKVVQASSDPDIDEIAGDAASAYAPADGLKRFVRRLYFVKPNALIVVDDIALDRPHELDLLFHPENTPVAQPDGSLLCTGPHAALRVDLLTPDAAAMTVSQIAVNARHPSGVPDQTVPQIDIAAQRQEWRNAVAFTWTAGGTVPAKATLTRAANIWTFHIGNKTVALDWTKPIVNRQ